MTKLSSLAWLGNAYIVASQWGEPRWQRPICLVWIGWVMLLWLPASGVEPGGNDQIVQFGLAR